MTSRSGYLSRIVFLGMSVVVSRLRVITNAGAQTIAAWGGHGRLQGRSGRVGPLLGSPMCLGITQRGELRHPLYISADTELVPWVPVHPIVRPKERQLNVRT